MCPLGRLHLGYNEQPCWYLAQTYVARGVMHGSTGTVHACIPRLIDPVLVFAMGTLFAAGRAGGARNIETTRDLYRHQHPGLTSKEQSDLPACHQLKLYVGCFQAAD